MASVFELVFGYAAPSCAAHKHTFLQKEEGCDGGADPGDPLVDDLDGETADETVEFGIDGKSYEIDLSKDNVGRLRDALAERRPAAAARAADGVAAAPAREARAAGRVRPRRRASIDREQN